MYIDLTTDCGCGCCGLRFVDNNNTEYAIQENPMLDSRIISNIDFATEIWVKFSNAGPGVQCVFTNYDASNPNGFWALIRNGNILEFIAGVNISGAAIFNNRISILSSTIQFNTWYHVVCNRITNNPVYWEIYVNGQKQNNGGVNLNPNFDHLLELKQKTKFGWWGFAGNNAFFSGTIAQARLYAKPLSQSEVRYNLKHGFYRPFSIEDIYFWAPFNNCTGVIADAFASNAIGGGAQIILNNFGSRINAGGGAWVNDCPTEDTVIQTCIANEDCKEKPTDEIIIERCDNLLFPPYTRKNPFINFSNYNTYNLYIDCTRQLFFESGFDWYQRNVTNWATTPNNLQTFELFLDLSTHKPQIVNITAHKYTCNEVTQVVDLAHIFPITPSAQDILNIVINWLESDVFPNSQISVIGVTNAPEQYILSVSVPPTNFICDNRIITLSKPNALRPGQEIPTPEPSWGDGIVVDCCTIISWDNAAGASNFCSSEAPPPSDPPAALCEDEDEVLVPFAVDENCLNLTVSGNCLEFSTPGLYNFQYNLIANINQLFGWQKTVCLNGRVRILVQMIVLDQTQTIFDYDYVKNDEVVDECNAGTLFWDGNNNTESLSNPGTSINFSIPVTQLNVTQQHIDDGDNTICLRTLVQTRAQLTCFGCDDPPASICCEARFGSLGVDNLYTGWSNGIQNNGLIGGPPWLFARDLNSASGGVNVNSGNICINNIDASACPAFTGVTIDGTGFLLSTPGDYTITLNLEYLRFICFLWQNTNCLTGGGTINLYLNIFGVQTLLDSYTINKVAETVDCNMPPGSTGLCYPVPFNSSTPPAGIPINITVPVNYPGGPNNRICLETSATVSADYTCTDCTGSGVGEPICRNLVYDPNRVHEISCSTSSTPPAFPTDDCESEQTSTILPGNSGLNGSEFFFDNSTGCLEILLPGTYVIDLINLIGSLVYDQTNYNLKNVHTYHKGYIKLKIANLPAIVLVNQISNFPLVSPNTCPSPDQQHVLTGSTFNQTINLNVTAAMISGGQNKICIESYVYAQVFGPGKIYCNPSEQGDALAKTTAKLQGTIKICKQVQGQTVNGEVLVRAANFVRGTLSICADTPPSVEDRFIEAIGDVEVTGELRLCQTEQIPPNCSFFRYNSERAIDCSIIVPYTDPLPIPLCEVDQLSPGNLAPIDTVVQDPLNVNGGNCIVFNQPGSYVIDINLTHAILEQWITENINCYRVEFEIIPKILLQGNTSNTDYILNTFYVDPSLCSRATPQTPLSSSYVANININITQTDIDNNNNTLCIYRGMRVLGEIQCIDCPGTGDRELTVGLGVTTTGTIKVCRNPSPPPAAQGEGTNWFGAENFANNRDRFLEDCFNVRSCFTGWVFWSNLCLRLWRDVICIKDNGTMLELPCNFQKLVDTSSPCNNLFQKLRLGYSYLDLLTDKHIAFCSQPIRVVANCDTILIRFRNDNEIFKTVRIEGAIEKISFNKNQEISYSSKGINRKLYSAVTREWELTTGYYTERFHVELMRALESDYFEAEINGTWERFIFEDTYQVEWDEADPGQKRGKATVKLKSYQRDVYNDFCVFEQ